MDIYATYLESLLVDKALLSYKGITEKDIEDEINSYENGTDILSNL